MTSVPVEPPRRLVEVTIDGAPVRVPEGATLLDACRSAGVDTPTLCWGDTLEPANACRVCVVEVEGARVLAPACSRQAEASMVVHTDSERVRHSRRMVLEFLGSSVDLSTTPRAAEWTQKLRRRPAPLRRRRRHGRPAAEGRQRPVRPGLRQVHPLLQVRRRLR